MRPPHEIDDAVCDVHGIELGRCQCYERTLLERAYRKAREDVAAELAPMLGADAARDAAAALGGSPASMTYNGAALARAVRAALDARRLP